MVLTPIEAKTRLPQYGLDSIEGFCEGWGELDQLGDISSQMLNTKYPYMGSMRVSWKALMLTIQLCKIIISIVNNLDFRLY